MTLAYTTGTITLTNGSAAVTGTGTGWQTALIAGGVIYPARAGNPMPILSVNSDTSITAAIPWTGTSGTWSYALVPSDDDGEQTEANRQALVSYIARLNNAALGALASIGGALAANKLPYATGAATMALADLSSWGRSLIDDANVAAFWSTIGDSAPAVNAYRRGNILGSVAQSGGVPSGALIERGSTTTGGEYVRLADGTQICTQTGVTIAYNITRRLTYSWTFPASFLSSSKTVIIPTAPYSTNDYVDVDPANLGGMFSSAGATSGTTGWWGGGTLFASTAALNNCALIAIGRWY